MSVVVLAGLGTVGVRAARQLVETDGIDSVLLVDHDEDRGARLARSLGSRAETLEWSPGRPLPGGVTAVASALPPGVEVPVVQAAIRSGLPAASVGDEHDGIEELRALGGEARSAGVTVAAGAGLAPGLADVLARHAAQRFDDVDEIRVARSGWAGPASVAVLRHELRSPAIDWHDGAWRTDTHNGEELVWFPEPIGGRDCRVVQLGVRLLVDAFPGVPSVSMCASAPQSRMRFSRFRRRGDETEWGAVRVEVWGRREEARDLVVYGLIERTAVAAGATLAVTTAHLAGATAPRLDHPGVHGLGALVDPVPFLAELAPRGVRAAVFEGVGV